MGYVPGAALLLALPHPVRGTITAMTRSRRPRSPVLRDVRERDLRRKIRSSREPGIQRPIANDGGITLPAGPEEFAADKLGPVLIVRVSVTGPLPKARVRLAGAKLQVMCAGSVPQEKLMVPVYPPTGVMVRTSVPELPDLIVRLPGAMLPVMLGVTMVSVNAEETLDALALSPLYVAVTE